MRKPYRDYRAVLTVGVSALALYPALSRAEQTTPASDKAAPADAASDSNDSTIAEIVVTGIRASLAKSLETKRNNDTISEALTADDIGKFPNTNVAEAMALMPGVTIDRRFGQGERVSIDGTDPSLNLTLLDGHPVAQAIWLYGETPNRGFDHTLLAPEMLGNLEVIKSSEARLPEGSLGGTVLLHSRKPLDLDANTFSGSVSYDYSDQADTGHPSASMLYSWKNAGSTFGFDVAAQHYEEEVNRQGIEVFGYHPVSYYAASNANVQGQVDNGELNADDMVPDEINTAYFQQKRKRDSVLANLQFAPIDNLDVNLSGLYIKENFDNYNQSMYNFMSWNSQSIGAVTHFDRGPSGVITGGHSDATTDAGVVYDNQLRQSEVKTKGVDLASTYQGEGWSLGGKLGASKSDNPHISQYLLEPVYHGGFSWDINKGFEFDKSAEAHDPANWDGTGWMGNNGVFSSHAKDKYAQLDFSKKFDGFFRELLVGARYNQHDEDYGLYVYGGVNKGTLADVGTIGETNTLNEFDVFEDFAHHVQVGKHNIEDWIGASDLDYDNPDPGSTLNNTWDLTQKNAAGYAQLNFANESVRGNIGVRQVHTKTESAAYVIPNNAAPVLPAPEGWWQSQSNTKNNFLPSFNIAWDVTNQIVLRGAAAKVIAWAPYNLMVNQTFLNDTVLTGSGGNPDIDPYKSYNYNVSAEWYFAPQSVLAVSGFYKDVQNYIFITPATERHYNSIKDTDPDSWRAMEGSGGCTADGYCDYSISRPHNEGGAKIYGYTVSYQQPFGGTGLGLAANYTFAKGKTDAGTKMPYQSRNSLSVSPYYEKGPLSARINYNYRSDYLGAGYVAGAQPATTDSYTDVSASVGWAFTENVSISVDGMNLLNEKYFQYQGSKDMPVARYTTGPRYMAGLHVKF
ncbi:TonB-dependent receptor [Solimonas marina]|uniref:TonB-dependent receptor n=1 Tax=Solimonas marina TaxID=2714601 RepID=A0A969W9S6_9GAMM|nr:TonB-dependent receptor [Solimonas marina]NKF22529.1 TonB-dependent receptor [Solimonas marina]